MGRSDRPTWHVAYLEAVPEDTAEIIRSRLPPGFALHVAADYSDETARELVRQADFVLVATRPLPARLIAAARRLRLIQHQGVGYDGTDVAAARAAGVPVALCPEGTTTGVAEHTILLILAVYRQLLRADASVRAGEWLQFGLRSGSHELAGKRLGLVGFGRIGRAVARRARAFEALVLYYDPIRPSPAEEADLEVTYRSFAELLAEVDILSLHLPATPETRHIVDAAALARMRPGSILINTARGSLVDQAALVAALQSGHLAGAGLDVFEEEPPRRTDPLLALPNVVLTPHVAAGTRDGLIAKMDAAFANMMRVARGELPLHVVEE
ncbi:MAG: 2-hydroxyacid dehydrogenase [Anaerolineae bacterium]|nr:2-hydroxyacid dehydrogenase [Anaerolineae bacterium]